MMLGEAEAPGKWQLPGWGALSSQLSQSSPTQRCSSSLYSFISRSTLILPVNNIPRNCEYLLLLLRSPLRLWAVFYLQFLVPPLPQQCELPCICFCMEQLQLCLFGGLKMEELIKNKRSTQARVLKSTIMLS